MEVTIYFQKVSCRHSKWNYLRTCTMVPLSQTSSAQLSVTQSMVLNLFHFLAFSAHRMSKTTSNNGMIALRVPNDIKLFSHKAWAFKNHKLVCRTQRVQTHFNLHCTITSWTWPFSFFHYFLHLMIKCTSSLSFQHDPLYAVNWKTSDVNPKPFRAPYWLGKLPLAYARDNDNLLCR